ncbi:hypothetical protein FA15DRAFT_606234, partial [Coprinopsis marcescibilis]
MSHNIVAVRHIPGSVNIADGLSRQFEGLPKGLDNDGSLWPVDPDSDDNVGLEMDVFGVGEEEVTDQEILELWRRFADDTYFLDIIDALLEIQPSRKTRLRDRQRGRHRAVNYMVEGRKLWFVGDGMRIWAVPHWECVTRGEAMEMAKLEPECGGHWHWDGIKIILLDQIHRSGLDKLIFQGI